MDKSKKSALTAALSVPQGQDGEVGQSDKGLEVDTSSFPCLSPNPQEMSGEIAKKLQEFSLERKSSLAGSAPTSVLPGVTVRFQSSRSPSIPPFTIRLIVCRISN